MCHALFLSFLCSRDHGTKCLICTTDSDDVRLPKEEENGCCQDQKENRNGVAQDVNLDHPIITLKRQMHE